MALPIRAGTLNTLNLGPALNIGTGVAMGSLNLAPSAVFLSKNGGIFAVKADANTAYHDRSGWYKVPVDTADTGTPGRLVVQASPTSCLETWQEYEVMPAAYYDALYGGTSSLRVIAEASSMAGFSFQAIANSVWNEPSRTVIANAASIPTFGFQAIANSVWNEPNGLNALAYIIAVGNSVWNTPGRNVSYAEAASIPGFSFQAVANSVWAHILTGTLQAQQIQRGLIAVLAGKTSGGLSDTFTFRNVADNKDVVVATMNTATGDRQAVVLDLT